MNSKQNPVKVGDIRPSQLLFTFGVGSLLDLPNMSVVVMGTDDWNTGYCTSVTEERLLAAVKARLGHQVTALNLPPCLPEDTDDPFGPQVGVPVVPFPRWFRCPRCDFLGRIDSGVFDRETRPYRPDLTRYVHMNCNKGNRPNVLSVRFLLACKNGHLDDFPWVWYVHHGAECPKGSPILRMREFGISGEASDIIVQCDACDARRRLGDAVGPDADEHLPKCTGRHPHLRVRGDGGCDESVRVTLLGASNSWFPITLSVLSIPRSEDKVAQLVNDNWAKLQKVRSIESLHDAREMGLFPSLAEFTDDEIWQAIEKKHSGGDGGSSGAVEDLKTPEWSIFSAASSSIATADFKLQTIAPPKGYERFVDKTVLVERIREVGALLSFTRVESPGDFFDGAEVPPERQAPLSRSAPTWVPASEVRGEGLFLQFNLQKLETWQNKKAVQARQKEFFEAHQEWRRLRKIEPTGAGFPGIWYILLHSFTHALMRQLSLECGYTAASVRERIYARTSEQGPDTMAGVLIYTAAPDSEGTLGGLVSLGMLDVLGRHIDQALEQVRLCASDPLCAEHLPVVAMTIHGAACHACLFAPETSCERGNKYLDRATLVQTYAAADLAFFE